MKNKQNILVYKLVGIVLKFIIFILGLPSLKLSRRIGKFCGRLFFKIDKRHRNIAINNLTQAYKDYDPAQIDEIALKNFEHLGMILFEVAWSLSLKKEDLFKYFVNEGRANVKRAYEKGKGVLLLTAHFGNFELLTVAAAKMGFPANTVYRPLDFPPLEEFIVKLRSRFGAKLFSTKERPFIAILKSLKRAEMIGLLMDQGADWYEGIFINFFGRRACSNSGMARLALRSKAPVVPLFIRRTEYGFKAVWLPELTFIETGDKRKDLEENTQQYNSVIESMVRQYPDQWFWVHQRWKVKAYCEWPRV